MSQDTERLKPASVAMMARSSAPVAAVGAARQLAAPLGTRAVQDINMDLVCEIGTVDITIGQLLKLRRGSFIDLSSEVVDEIELYVNGRAIAYGEPISARTNYAVKISRLELRPEIEDEA
jgi:flagellar motor switch/type III secretory pathway protein FliN